MVTIEQAKEAINNIYGEEYEILLEFIKQTEEYLKEKEEKTKRIPHLLNNKP